jgi:hypothetical protein
MTNWTGVLTASVAVAALAVSGGEYAAMHSAQDQVTSQARQVQRTLRADGQQISELQGTVSGLSSQLASPADPFGAYDQICNAMLTNQSTGTAQTFYYPCTNSVQTIPQPGD